jgi:hypothetical protein
MALPQDDLRPTGADRCRLVFLDGHVAEELLLDRLDAVGLHVVPQHPRRDLSSSLARSSRRVMIAKSDLDHIARR